jgi:RND family efflux transporter MFP subunit
MAGLVWAFVLKDSQSVIASGKSTDSSAGSNHNGSVEIPVNTVRPRKKTLERVLVQPGSIQPAAEAELYAKTSGYLKHIRRAPTEVFIANLNNELSAVSVAPVASVAGFGIAVHQVLRTAPEKDIGSKVAGGEVLLEIATPERLQEIVEKESLLQQRQAELESARTSLNTFQAGVEAAKAQKVQVMADARKNEFEHVFRTKELTRLKELASSGTVTPQVVDEKQSQVDAALAAWDSSRAKVQTAEADLAVAMSKLDAANADLRVKELLVQVSRDALRQAQILADYSSVRAPFDGIITYRGVDEGDFIQNATSGQSRRLMTVASIDKVKVSIQIPERDTPWIRLGSEAHLTLDALKGGEVVGHVARVANSLDPETRTMRVEIDLDNRDHKLLPGMYGEVSLTLQKIPDAQAIPATALYSRRGENYIILVQDGKTYRQLVRVRYDDGREVEIVKRVGDQEVPLDGTEEVVVSNKGELSEGQKVRPIRSNGN